MPEALSDAQWAAIRALLEGAFPTHQRVAQATDVYVKTISRRAGDEKWKTLDFRHKRVGAAHRAMIALAARFRAGEEMDPAPREEDEAGGPDGMSGAAETEALPPLEELEPQERIARIGDMLTRRTEAILQRAEAGQPIEGRQVAILSSMVQLSERIATLARERAQKEQIKSDDELAALLGKIDHRIVELATYHAYRILIKTGMNKEEAMRLTGVVPE